MILFAQGVLPKTQQAFGAADGVADCTPASIDLYRNGALRFGRLLYANTIKPLGQILEVTSVALRSPTTDLPCGVV